ncbi:hypothetical protein MMC10_006468 [Thelotrema lepadinum]|nr:hypothetical protein [Thelotrema lepadinum]
MPTLEFTNATPEEANNRFFAFCHDPHSDEFSENPADTIYYLKTSIRSTSQWIIEGPVSTLKFASLLSAKMAPNVDDPEKLKLILPNFLPWLGGLALPMEFPYADVNEVARLELIKVRNRTVRTALPCPTWTVEFFRCDLESFNWDQANSGKIGVPYRATESSTALSVHESLGAAEAEARKIARHIARENGNDTRIEDRPSYSNSIVRHRVYKATILWSLSIRYESGECLRGLETWMSNVKSASSGT